MKQSVYVAKDGPRDLQTHTPRNFGRTGDGILYIKHPARGLVSFLKTGKESVSVGKRDLKISRHRPRNFVGARGEGGQQIFRTRISFVFEDREGKCLLVIDGLKDNQTKTAGHGGRTDWRHPVLQICNRNLYFFVSSLCGS